MLNPDGTTKQLCLPLLRYVMWLVLSALSSQVANGFGHWSRQKMICRLSYCTSCHLWNCNCICLMAGQALQLQVQSCSSDSSFGNCLASRFPASPSSETSSQDTGQPTENRHDLPIVEFRPDKTACAAPSRQHAAVAIEVSQDRGQQSFLIPH